MRKTFAVLAILGIVSGCQLSNTPVKPIDYRETPTPTDTDLCGVAGRHLSTLCEANKEENSYCCMTSASTKKGKSFTQFCEETQHAGIALNPGCLSKIIKCEEIDFCLGTTR
jgi:hypothetical protein